VAAVEALAEAGNDRAQEAREAGEEAGRMESTLAALRVELDAMREELAQLRGVADGHASRVAELERHIAEMEADEADAEEAIAEAAKTEAESPPEVINESGEEIHPVPHDEAPQEIPAEKKHHRRRFFI
jgi:predicted nuclease with TOPRIM domain